MQKCTFKYIAIRMNNNKINKKNNIVCVNLVPILTIVSKKDFCFNNSVLFNVSKTFCISNFNKALDKQRTDTMQL